MKHRIYIFILSLVFVAFTIVFNGFKRSTYSALEKRSLVTFPQWSIEALTSGKFTTAISSWYSDTEPYRDFLLQASMTLKHWKAIDYGTDDEVVTFHAAAEKPAATEKETNEGERNVEQYTNELTANDNAKIANRGIIVVGTGDNVRALMAYGGGAKGGGEYARAANVYQETLGSGVQVYCMVIPTAVEYYCPDKAKKATNPQQPTIKHIYSLLSPEVKAVDVYTTLGQHASEPIYLRTDHHWSPLGAYYAAAQFAKVAGVPFKPLTAYNRKVVKKIVGSMYGYAKDIALKNAPEDFVYYVPKDVSYTTYFTDYKVDKNYRVVGMGKERKGIFFQHYKDGNGGAYCTFMGSDMNIVRVTTSTKTKRKVLILKDSFGNALPGYLFYSFAEIHVVDFRYFTKNIKQYITNNHITDVLFANNIFNAYSSKIGRRYISFLHQKESVPTTEPAERKKDSKGVKHKKDSVVTTTKPVTEKPVKDTETATKTSLAKEAENEHKTQ